MQILILYRSFHGTTKHAAEGMAEGLRRDGHQATVQDVRAALPDLAGVDGVIIGAPTRFGRVTGRAKAALRKIARRAIRAASSRRVRHVRSAAENPPGSGRGKEVAGAGGSGDSPSHGTGTWPECPGRGPALRCERRIRPSRRRGVGEGPVLCEAFRRGHAQGFPVVAPAGYAGPPGSCRTVRPDSFRLCFSGWLPRETGPISPAGQQGSARGGVAARLDGDRSRDPRLPGALAGHPPIRRGISWTAGERQLHSIQGP